MRPYALPDGGNAISDGVNTLVDGLTGVITDQGAGMLTDMFSVLLRFIGDMVAGTCQAILRWVLDLVLAVASPTVGADFVYDWAGRIFAIALVVIVGFMLLQLIVTLARGGGLAGAPRSLFGGGAAVLGTVVSIPIVGALVGAVDAVAEDLLVAVVGDIDALTESFAGIYDSDLMTWATADALLATSGTTSLNPTAVVAGLYFVPVTVFGLITIVSAVLIGGTLIVRNALLYIMAAIGPLMIAGITWEATRGWAKRWVEIVLALVVTKLGIVIVLGLGVSVLREVAGNADGYDSFGAWAGAALVGIVILMVGAFVPVVAMKLMSFIGDEVGTAMLAREATAGARGLSQRAGGAASTNVRQMLQQSNRSSGVGGAGPAGPRGPSGPSVPRPVAPTTAAPAAGAGSAPAAGSAGASSGGAAAGGGVAAGVAGAGVGVLVGAASAARGATSAVGGNVSAAADQHAAPRPTPTTTTPSTPASRPAPAPRPAPSPDSSS